jgi:hypothetical protein
MIRKTLISSCSLLACLLLYLAAADNAIMSEWEQQSVVGGKKKRTCQTASDSDNSPCSGASNSCIVHQPTCSQAGTQVGDPCFQVKDYADLPICKGKSDQSLCCDHAGEPIPCYVTIDCKCLMIPGVTGLECSEFSKATTNRGRCQQADCQ